ncbi:SigB/SigF/SigG family RNA polymerase sigma factor [Conexibacter sp. JD483]|uniref:SigB/SigF/SigG family RNA polymerase sigma factor n=1 Tax=unclassified Conexibacter TaxID=2627773 RepID=UPI0027168E87|nr:MULTISPECIES: SigB/SigF/SigG family RNA polymerase sigma factor [unclassified Conexibacter]MDO8188520.1 SigB/SigF/SigG family RNA polymerase sigma factor [Conexibacter sp. CPCC 205706]MDO8200136.1 SigB/SigF/SigG family RNA polymerase sigma factor [Conexibacter sp. CPCC 205762]MDR9371175.1 SigB/SigF/SigG family RNA polymerase sigma factor [Conexibacter sp. JD483]
MITTPSPTMTSASLRTAGTPRITGRAEDLLRRYRATGDPRWRTRTIEEYLPLAHKLARRYHPGPEPLEDLVQVACVGLVKAVDRFDPDAGPRFASFAIPTITGELRRHFRDTTWSVHVPRGVQEDTLRLRQATTELTERVGRSPTIGELAAATGLDVERTTEALQATSAKETASLDRPVLGSHDDGGATVGDTIGSDEHGFLLAEHRAEIGPALRALPPQYRQILHLRFAEDLTQTEIGARVGCSQMQVSRLLRRALDQLAAG